MSEAPGVSRRGLIGAGVAAATLGGVPGAQAATKRSRSTAAKVRKVDVVVVGAGLAGLTAARDLVAGGRSVVVLEAANQVGGRIRNREVAPGKVTEVGGQFVGPTQERILALAAEFGVERFPGYSRTGDSVYIADGQATRYQGDIPPDAGATADLAKTVVLLDQMAAALPVDAPWTAADARALDSQTLESWLRGNSANADRMVALINIFLNSAFGGAASDASLLFTLAQIAGFGDERHVGTVERGIGGAGGAQDSRLVGGSQVIAQRLAARLGRRVRLNAPVRAIRQTAGSVTVTSDAGVWKGRHAVVAIPPPLSVAIDWSPVLPVATDALRRRMPLGTLAKVFAVYDRPFWRDAGLKGMAIKVDGTTKEMFDNSPPGDGAPGVIMGFMGGPAWRFWMARPLAERRAAVLTDFAEGFGAAALRPKDYFEQDWTSEPWIRGGPVSVLATGTLSDFGPALRRPFNRVHWAGTETSVYWNGFMDGAVRSGERAAREVLDR